MRTITIRLVSAAAFAAASPFDGRWDIAIEGDNSRAWWLGLEGVGTPGATGIFVSA